MFNLQQRANNVFSFALTSLGTVLAVVALLSAIFGYGTVDDKIRIDKKNVQIVTRRYGSEGTDYGSGKSEFAKIKFDLEADFTPLFNWNTKQVFVTVVAQYENKNFGKNQIVIWDKIITSKEKAHLKLRNVSNKYSLVDVNRKWNSENANLTLIWDVTPYVGMLQSGKSNKGSQFVLSSASQRK